MKMKRILSVTALLLALMLMVSGCGGKAKPSDEDVTDPGVSEPIDLSSLLFMNPLIPPDGVPNDMMPNLVAKVLEADAINSDAIGWLQVPNTTIDEVVVKHEGDTSNSKAYYLRLDFEGKSDQQGTYYVDYRNKVYDGREGLSKNTVIYGHSFTDDIEGLKMNQLKKFRADEEFAVANPYVFFSLEDVNLAWEVFAVFDATINLHYNNPIPTDEEFLEMISEAQKRSYYNYDVQVNADDKILTLSTCTYNYDKRYPNNYRYIVMAKLVPEGEMMKDTAKLEINTDKKAP